MDFWVALWTVLLWASAIAFGLVNLYIVAGAVRKFVAARKKEPDPVHDVERT